MYIVRAGELFVTSFFIFFIFRLIKFILDGQILFDI